MQKFETGATRNSDENKFDYEGFFNPLVLKEYGQYMHEHRKQADGEIRDSDNWQKGMPLFKYMKSILRHTFDLWLLHRGYRATNPDTGKPVGEVEALCAIMFNVMGYLLETLKADKVTHQKDSCGLKSTINAKPGQIIFDKYSNYFDDGVRLSKPKRYKAWWKGEFDGE